MPFDELSGIYDDLDVIHEPNIEQKYAEIEQQRNELLQKLQIMETSQKTFLNDLNEMKKVKEALDRNISELFKTAKLEIARKERQNKELLAEVEKLKDKLKNIKQIRSKYPEKNIKNNENHNNGNLKSRRDISPCRFPQRRSSSPKNRNSRQYSSTYRGGSEKRRRTRSRSRSASKQRSHKQSRTSESTDGHMNTSSGRNKEPANKEVNGVSKHRDVHKLKSSSEKATDMKEKEKCNDFIINSNTDESCPKKNENSIEKVSFKSRIESRIPSTDKMHKVEEVKPKEEQFNCAVVESNITKDPPHASSVDFSVRDMDIEEPMSSAQMTPIICNSSDARVVPQLNNSKDNSLPVSDGSKDSSLDCSKNDSMPIKGRPRPRRKPRTVVLV